jgi:hypothetical protein
LKESANKILVGRLKGKEYLGDLGRNERIILIQALRKQNVRMWIQLMSFRV